MNTDQVVNDFALIRPRYEKMCQKVRGLLTDLLVDAGMKTSIEHRVKDVASFREKITREGKDYTNPLQEITDIGGIRIILNSLADVELAANIIKKEFLVDEENSINKLDQLEPDRFGYLSQHYIVSTNSQRVLLTEWADTSGLRIEIQVRTALQHAWAVIQHALQYKSSLDVPKTLQRRLFRVSALLELADEELDTFGKEMRQTINSYKTQLKAGDSNLALDVDSFRVFVATSPSVEYWNNVIRAIGLNVESEGDLSRDLRFFSYVGIDNLSQVESMLSNARGWGEEFFGLLYEMYCNFYGTTTSNISVVTNGAITQLTIATYNERFSEKVLSDDFGFNNAVILKAARVARPSPTDARAAPTDQR